MPCHQQQQWLLQRVAAVQSPMACLLLCAFKPSASHTALTPLWQYLPVVKATMLVARGVVV